MLGVKFGFGNASKTICTFDENATADEVCLKVTELTGLTRGDFYIVINGRLVSDKEICENGTAVEIVPRLKGGKGGFGSMLRAIGAQIEKTTNREACRDLSGRRLRDINEEKRLKSWIDKQASREEEAVERKKKKLERLCAQPKHEFKDKNYENERSALTEKVGDAVEEGFKLAMQAAAGNSGEKRQSEDKERPRNKRIKLAVDSDIDSDELSSSSDEEEDSRSQIEREKTESGSSPSSLSSSSSSQVPADTGGDKSETSESLESLRNGDVDEAAAAATTS